MTRYYDKHGTEVRARDTMECKGTKFTANPDPGMDENRYSESTVLSRADGTPVYRYKGGEDVRVGDTYACMMEVCGRSHKVDEQKLAGRDIEWSERTLIRRAGESEKPRGGMSAKEFMGATFCKKHQSYFLSRCGLCERDEASVVLGVDRNGREVRRGHTLKTVSGSFVADSWDFGRFVSADRSHVVAAQYCELVTDEKAEPRTMPRGRPCNICGAESVHGESFCVRCLYADEASDGPLRVERIEPTTPDIAHMERADWKRCAAVLESLCRALAKPTMAQSRSLEDGQFVVFKSTIRRILRECAPNVSVVFDAGSIPFDNVSGKQRAWLAWLECDGATATLNWNAKVVPISVRQLEQLLLEKLDGMQNTLGGRALGANK